MKWITCTEMFWQSYSSHMQTVITNSHLRRQSILPKPANLITYAVESQTQSDNVFSPGKYMLCAG